jgi:hypothetical protein
LCAVRADLQRVLDALLAGRQLEGLGGGEGGVKGRLMFEALVALVLAAVTAFYWFVS